MTNSTMKDFTLFFLLALPGLFLFSCTEELDVKPSSDVKNAEEVTTSGISTGARITTSSEATDVIDFEGVPNGTIISEVFSAGGAGPIAVYGLNPNFPEANAAMIFDSSIPSKPDPDLNTPNEDFGGPGVGEGGNAGSAYENDTALGNVLIITSNFDSSNPNDADEWGSLFALDFSGLGSVTVSSMHIVDVEVQESNATVLFYDASGDQIGSTFVLPQTGDNGVALYEFGSGVEGVVGMEIIINGSGAIDNIAFTPEGDTPPTDVVGCTYTQGYWKNHTKYSAARRDDGWDNIGPLGEDTEFFLSGSTYLEVLKTAPKGGNAYFILAHQYIAAKLNVLNGTSAPELVTDVLAEAEALFNAYTPAQIGALKGSNALRKTFIEHAKILDQYNNGIIGPGHCD